MLDCELKQKLSSAETFEEVQGLLEGGTSLDANQVWEEVRRHRDYESKKLDLEELDAISGGADRDWVKDGCAATCEVGSWCSSNDYCVIWDVTYDRFWTTCPDGHEHVFDNCKCVRCGYVNEGYSPG